MPQPTPRGRWAAGHPVSSPLSIPAAEHPFRCEITSAIAKREYVSYVQMTRVFASQHRILSGQSGPHRLFVRSCYVFDPSQHMLPANLLTLRDRHTRRAWLRLGMLGGLAGLRRCTTASDDVRGPGFGRAKSVICVFTSGGQSQLETWDPKPAAPREIRGDFASIPTRIPGIRFGEHMPRIAGMADRLCVVRSMSHADLDHGSAFYLSMTGHYHRRISSNPAPAATDHPAQGAILKRVRPRSKFVHPAVHLNGPALVPILEGPGQSGGFLGRDYAPLVVGDVTASRHPVPDLEPVLDVPSQRMADRQRLLQTIDSIRGRTAQNRRLLDWNGLYRQAFDMLDRPQTRHAFDLSREPAAVRDRYGRNRSGQACLLARRLVEAGVPFITVIWNHSNRGQDQFPEQTDTYGWDTHNDIFHAMKHHLMPRFDLGFSALLEDMQNRGLLDETLIICMGEFGRAPRVAREPRFAGSAPGRKHWSAAYSIALAGAGVAPGSVVGASDSAAAYPRTAPYGPWDVTATVFSALGIDPQHTYRDRGGKPIRIAEGQPISAIYA